MLGTQGCVHPGLRLVALCWATSPQTSVLAMLCRGGSLAQETRGAEMCDGDRATLALQLQRVLAPQQGGGTPLADKSPPAPQKSQGLTPGPVCPALTAGWDRHTSSPQSSGVCVQVRSPNQAGSACDAPSHHLLPAPLPKLQSPGACLAAAPSWQGSLPASRHPQLCVRPAPHCSRHAHHGVLPGASTKPSHHRGFGEPASGSGKEGRGGGPRDSVGPTGRSLQPGDCGPCRVL